MGLGGVEPPTSRLSGVRSNHLSYRPRASVEIYRASGASSIDCDARTACAEVPGATHVGQTRSAPRLRGVRGAAMRTIECDACEVATREPLSALSRGEAYSVCSVKEVIQPQVPLRLPCYDFAPVTALAFGRSVFVRSSCADFGRSQLPWRDGRCVQGPGTYSPWRS